MHVFLGISGGKENTWETQMQMERKRRTSINKEVNSVGRLD
jgi:hypothetical protein